MPVDPRDTEVRLAAFEWLREQTAIHGEVLPWRVLLAGFQHRGDRVPLVSQQGIFKPRVCHLPLSIRTSPDGPYADTFSADSLLLYRYRGSDPNHRENAGLREAMRLHVPLVYLFGHTEGRYHAVWPAFIVGDNPAGLTFTVAHGGSAMAPGAWDAEGLRLLAGEPQRAYGAAETRRRLHQAAFRERVLAAYRTQCALCRLRHRELLDAAHIIADSDPEGEPIVANGLSLCKLHHAAFDHNLIGVNPDYRIIVRRDLLEEHDGPMLRHGLQELHGAVIAQPHRTEHRPSRERLEVRFQRFLEGDLR